MKFSSESVSEGVNHITGCNNKVVTVQSYQLSDDNIPVVTKTDLVSSCIITPTLILDDWPPESFADLTHSHFEQLIELEPELVLFGAGVLFKFPEPSLTRSLIDANIGVEVMDTPAACRTYNVLVLEERKVIAALLV